MEERGDLVSLTKVLRELRAHLEEAISESEKEMVQFDLDSVELEFCTVIVREASGGGKLSFKLLSIGGEGDLGGKISDQQTQKLKLVLTPFENEHSHDDDEGRKARRRKIVISDTKSTKGRRRPRR
jgi:hypothetical protein